LAAVLAFFTGIMFGSYFVLIYGWPILLVGVVSVLAAWFYTAKPLSLGYRALGELEEFTFMGPVIVVASYYVQVGSLALTPILVSLLVGMLVLPILHANNLRDVVQDDERNRLTWVVLAYRRLGAEKGKAVSIRIYCLSITAAYVTLLVLTLLHHMPFSSLLALLTIPEAYAMIRFVRSGIEGKPLSRLVRGTARLEMLFGIMLTVGYALDILLHPR
jgi:1,4-dihydroxy-2-naphthoate octaprenyltransferase